MTRLSIVIVSVALAAFGCKGETVVKPDPQTAADLDACKKSVDEKDKLIKAEEEENARLMREKGSGAEIVVSIEGNMLTVHPGKPGEVRPIDDKAAAAAAKEFEDLVAKSRGKIQRCYEQALKKRNDLQARTVTLTVSASFQQSGAFSTSSFAPSLGDVFDSCMQTVAKSWVLKQNSPALTFKASVSLTPS